jgi:hypothetical protein
MKLGKSPTETLELHREANRKDSLSQTVVFKWHSHFYAGQMVKCQLKMTNIQGNQAPAKRQKTLTNSRTHPLRPSPNNP